MQHLSHCSMSAKLRNKIGETYGHYFHVCKCAVAWVVTDHTT